MNHLKLKKSLNYLAPIQLKSLIRIGNKRDGGYVLEKNSLKKINFLLSFGLANNFTFEKNFLKLNNKSEILIYDHTVNKTKFFLDFIKSIKRMIYFKSNINNIKRKYFEFIDYLNLIKNPKINHYQIKVSNKNTMMENNLDKIFNEIKRKKILLSIDIEGDEYKILKNINKYHSSIHLLVVEFHHLNKNRVNFEKIIKLLKKKFNIIHIHGNNYTSICNDGLPITLEITFRNKILYPVKIIKYVKKFPIKYLDYPNLEGKSDIKFIFDI